MSILLCAGATIYGQQPAATSAVPEVSRTGQPTFTLRTGTNLVVEQVTVIGSDGKPVHALKAQNFVLTENGKPQRIRNFAEHAADEVPKTAAIVPPKLAPGIFTNNTQKASGGPANILLLDMLNTPLRDQQYARQQIQQFLDHAPAGTQIAVFGLNSRLTLLQGFTGDFGLLKTALSRSQATGVSSLLDDSLGGGGSGNNPAGISEALSDTATSPDTKELIANAQQFEADSQSFQLNLRTVFTLDALNEIARYLSNIPGRKNLIWFSASFPVDLLPDASTQNGFSSMASHEAEFRETVNLLARSQIALYPVDARGLQTTGTFNAASQSTKYNRDATKLGKDIASFDAQIGAENASMEAVARETGGHAFINTNGLSEALASAIDDGTNYYTLAYTPSAPAGASDEYRQIKVSLPGKPFTLSYRRGYYEDSTAAGAPPQGAKAVSPADNSPITRSMVRGAPVPTQIEFTVRVRPLTGKDEPVVAPGNEVVSREPAAAAPYTRLAIDYAIDQQSLSFQKVDGNFRGNFEFIAFVYDANGTLLNRVGSTLHADFTPSVYANFLRQPFSFNQDISVPRAGNLFMRIAVHDLSAEHVGAVEVPVDSVRNLPPLEPAAK